MSGLSRFGRERSKVVPLGKVPVAEGTNSTPADPEHGGKESMEATPTTSPGAGASPGANKFRAIGGVVRALQRFQNALNPTMPEFGSYKDKIREQEENKHHQVPGMAVKAAARGGNNGRANSSPTHPTMSKTGSLRLGADASSEDQRRSASGRPKEAGHHHGHKGTMLLKPLPGAGSVS